MARCKNSPDTLRAKSELADRLRQIRTERFGERGGPELSRQLGLPVRTWYNYEVGVTVPGEVLLRFVDLLGVEPQWLLHGEGPKYRPRSISEAARAKDGDSVVGLLRRALELLDTQVGSLPGVAFPPESRPAYSDSDDSSDSEDTLLIHVRSDHGADPDRSGPEFLKVSRDCWVESDPDFRCARNRGDAMEPVLSDGAFVGFAARPEPVEDLDGELVAYSVDGHPIFRWLQLAGRFALLRAENPAREAILPVDLEGSPPESRQFRRVLWASSGHGAPVLPVAAVEQLRG